MTSGRADPFANLGSEDKLDLKHFKPLKRPERVDPEEVRKVAESASFKSREPLPAQPAVPEASDPRLFRTGRNVQFSAKVTKEINAEIYALSDELGQRMEREMPGMRWTLGMTVERMVAALKREMSEQG